MTAPAFVPVAPGSLVAAAGRTYRVTHMLSIDSVLADDIETRVPERLRIDALGPVPAGAQVMEAEAGAKTAPDLEAIDEAEWAVAQRRFAAIKPLLDDPFRTRAMVEAAAAAHGVNTATLYEWMRLYAESGHLSALVPRQRGRKRGTKLVRA